MKQYTRDLDEPTCRMCKTGSMELCEDASNQPRELWVCDSCSYEHQCRVGDYGTETYWYCTECEREEQKPFRTRGCQTCRVADEDRRKQQLITDRYGELREDMNISDFFTRKQP